MAHPEHLKAAAMAALLSGQSAHKVAERFALSRTTIRRWRDEAWASTQNGPQKKAIGVQVQGYITESLETQRAQLHVMNDHHWLFQLSARELAQLHGGLFDQAVRLLGALAFDEETNASAVSKRDVRNDRAA